MASVETVGYEFVMDDHPVEVLARLLADGPKPDWGSIQVVKCSESQFESGDRARDLEEVIARYTDLAQRAAAEVQAIWGPPTFIGEVQEAPPTEWAYWECFLWMACWSKGHVQAFVAVCHQDTELPVMLLFGVADVHQA